MPPRPFHCTALPIEGDEAAAAAAAPGQLRDLQFQLGRSVAHVAALLLVLVLVWSGLVLPLMRAAIALETHKPHAPRTHTHSCTHTPKTYSYANSALVFCAPRTCHRCGHTRCPIGPTPCGAYDKYPIKIARCGNRSRRKGKSRGKGSGLAASGTM